VGGCDYEEDTPGFWMLNMMPFSMERRCLGSRRSIMIITTFGKRVVILVLGEGEADFTYIFPRRAVNHNYAFPTQCSDRITAITKTSLSPSLLFHSVLLLTTSTRLSLVPEIRSCDLDMIKKTKVRE
jgi:hypothetical protein